MCEADVGRNQPKIAMYNDGGGGIYPGVGLNKKQYIINGMTHVMGLHLVFDKADNCVTPHNITSY